ncbi:hypothetical protein BDY19DRAFT_713346 [Irpex rosettiformis]|uniref:Uncharacterized protein n=1 Tax=Irpex rosettiformis TaxID=378272 RepID=A0ACB8U801_9APHY|nr:hypothetical protein BDY19DRAFT_713346 [Irpex rosettiformis]
MGISDLPPELFERILVHSACDLRQILRFKAVSKSFNDFITNSARLRYHIDLFVSGFQDTHLNPTCNLHDRQTILSAAQNIWRNADSMALLETLHVSNLEYWPIRDSVLLRKVSAQSPEPDSVTFDVSQISSCVGATSATDVLSHWKVRLQKEAGSIACIDPAQDLLIVRCNGAPHPINQPSTTTTTSSESTSPTGDLDADPGRYYCLSIHSLRTGDAHPRAKHPHIQFKMSQRVVKNPHYTRVQVLDNILAVNMASGFQLFTETTFFDWKTGDMKSIFCSPGTSARAWGHPAVLISDQCFLQPCYSSAERRPAIEVYVLDDSPSSSSESHESGRGPREASHVATYWLPRVNNGDVRLIINITSRQQVSTTKEDRGFLLSSSYARMLHVQITGVWFTSPFQCAFFTPAHQFIDESIRFLALPRTKRVHVGVHSRPWATWGDTSTRWLEKDGPMWHEQAKSNLRGSGSRYAFPKYLVDFSPLDVAREVYRYKQRRHYPLGAMAFASSEAKGWTTHCHQVAKSQISGAEMFDEEIVSCLPFREKGMDELPEYEMGSDVLVVNDKIVTIQGGVQDVIKIYKPVASPWEQETDELASALEAITLNG